MEKSAEDLERIFNVCKRYENSIKEGIHYLMAAYFRALRMDNLEQREKHSKRLEEILVNLRAPFQSLLMEAERKAK